MAGSSLVQITQFELVWSNRENSDDNDAREMSIWRAILPKAPSPSFAFCRLGDVAVFGYDKPAMTLVVLSDLSDGVVRKPMDYKLQCSNEEISFWSPTPPEGYIALGNVCSKEKPASDVVACVLRQSVLMAPLADAQLWSENNCGIWSVENGFGTFLATNSLNERPKQSPFKLNSVEAPMCALQFFVSEFPEPRLGITVKDGCVTAVAAACVANPTINVGDRIIQVAGLCLAGGSDGEIIRAIKKNTRRPLTIKFCRVKPDSGNSTARILSNMVKGGVPSKTQATSISRNISTRSTDSDGWVDVNVPPKVPPRSAKPIVPSRPPPMKKNQSIGKKIGKGILGGLEKMASAGRDLAAKVKGNDEEKSVDVVALAQENLENEENAEREAKEAREAEEMARMLSSGGDGGSNVCGDDDENESAEAREAQEAEEMARMLGSGSDSGETDAKEAEELARQLSGGDPSELELSQEASIPPSSRSTDSSISNEKAEAPDPPERPKRSSSLPSNSADAMPSMEEMMRNATKAREEAAKLAAGIESDNDEYQVEEDGDGEECAIASAEEAERLAVEAAKTREELRRLGNELDFDDLRKKGNLSDEVEKGFAVSEDETPNRKLYCQGLLTKKGTRSLFRGDRQRLVLLFSDLLVVAEEKTNRKGKRVVHSVVQLLPESPPSVHDLAGLGEAEAPFSFKIADPRSREYTFIASDEDTKIFWLEKLMLVLTTLLPAADPRRGMKGFKHGLVQGTIHSACVQGRADLLKTLLLLPRNDAGVSAAGDVNGFDDEGFTPLHYCVLYRHTRCVEVLIRGGEEEDSTCNSSLVVDMVCNSTPLGRTALCMAADLGEVDILHLLLKKGASVGWRDANQQTPLHIAVEHALDDPDATANYHKCIQHLLHYGVRIQKGNNFRDSKTGETLLSIVAKEAYRPGATHIVSALVNMGADPNRQRPTDGFTPLIITCSVGSEAKVEVLECLLAAGAQPNLRDGKGQTPLHVLLQSSRNKADMAGISVLAMCLLRGGARLDIHDGEGVSPAELCSPALLNGFEAARAMWSSRKGPSDMPTELARLVSKGACHLLEKDPRWVKDTSSDNCLLCGAIFNLMRRRHHCKMCGTLVCWNCCSKDFPLALLDMENPPAPGKTQHVEVKDVKVCDGCFNRACTITDRIRPRLVAKLKMRAEKAEEKKEERRAEARAAAAAKARANLGLSAGEGVSAMSAKHQKKASAQATKNALSRARDAANERGEKLSQLQDKSAQMADAAGDFSDMCRQLRNKQEKKIFGIF